MVMGVVGATTVQAGSRDLSEDDHRKSLALHDETIGLELRGGLTLFGMDTHFSDAVNAPMQEFDTTNTVTWLDLQVGCTVFKVMGIGIGYFHVLADNAGVFDGAPSSLSDGGFSMQLDAYPIGFRRVQTMASVELVYGDSMYATVYSVGARIDLGKFKLIPRASYTEFSVDEDVYITEAYNAGWGASVQLAWTFAGSGE